MLGFVIVESLWSQGLTMKDAANLAIEVSPELREAYAQQILKEGAWVVGIRAFLPKLNLSASENDRLSTIGSDSFTKTYTIGIQQLIWDGGRLGANRSIEKAELDLHRVELRRKVGEVGEAAINLYRTIINKEAVFRIKQDNLTALELQYTILEEEYRRGLALQTDLDEAAISIEDSRLNLESLRLELEVARNEFTVLLSLPATPELSDSIDTTRSTLIPRSYEDGLLSQLAQYVLTVHPDLIRQRMAIEKLQVQLQNAHRSWWPTLKLTGDFSVLGDRYPLSRYSYSVGLSMEFSGPLLSGSIGGKAGWEGSTDRTALLQSSTEPIPDPASVFSEESLKAMFSLEQERYHLLLKKIEQQTKKLLQSCIAADDRRLIASRQRALAQKKLSLLETRHSLGQATTLDVMKARIELSSNEIALVEAAVALLEAERALERHLDLESGSLEEFLKSIQGKGQ